MIAQEFRFVVLYPVQVAFSIAWFLLFMYRYNKCKSKLRPCYGYLLAAMLGAGTFTQAASGLIGLYMRGFDLVRFQEIASFLFTVGIAAIVAILIFGVVLMVFHNVRGDEFL